MMTTDFYTDRHFLDKLTQVEQFGCKGKDLDHLQTKFNSAVKGLKDSNGYSADPIIVTILVNMFDKQHLQGWRQHIHDQNDPPDIIHLQYFLDYQCTILPDDRFQSSTCLERPPKLKSLPPKNSALKIQENIKNTRKTKCVLRSADHALFLFVQNLKKCQCMTDGLK